MNHIFIVFPLWHPGSWRMYHLKQHILGGVPREGRVGPKEEKVAPWGNKTSLSEGHDLGCPTCLFHSLLGSRGPTEHIVLQARPILWMKRKATKIPVSNTSKLGRERGRKGIEGQRFSMVSFLSVVLRVKILCVPFPWDFKDRDHNLM